MSIRARPPRNDWPNNVDAEVIALRSLRPIAFATPRSPWLFAKRIAGCRYDGVKIMHSPASRSPSVRRLPRFASMTRLAKTRAHRLWQPILRAPRPHTRQWMRQRFPQERTRGSGYGPTPVGRNGQIVLRPMATFSLSSDYHIVAGVIAAPFMADLRGVIESP